MGRLSNDAVSVASTSGAKPPLKPNLTLTRVPTGRASETMNRLASLSNLSQLHNNTKVNKTGMSPTNNDTLHEASTRNS